MPSPQDIAQYQERLITHRATLASLLIQQATHTSAFAPPAVVSGIREARTAIAQLKATLRGWGESVEDLPADGEVPVPPQPVPPRPPEPIVLPKPTQRLKVFLCHASEDKPAVRQLAQRLRAVGVAPWLDADDLLPGQRWQIAIPNAVRTADVVLVCLSQHAVTKAGYVQQELAFALNVAAQQPEDAIYLIPLRLEDCTAPEHLRDRQWVDLFADDGFQRLLRALQVRAAEVGALPPAVPPVGGASPPRQRTAWNPSWRYLAGALLVVVSLLGLTWVSRRPGTVLTPTATGAVALAIITPTATEIATPTATVVPPPTATEAVAQATITPTATETATPLSTWVPEMVKVPAGSFLMGSTEQQIATVVSQGANADWVKYEKTQHSLPLPDYWIGKTEVTNAQFRPFVDGDGYTNRAYWTEAGWAWRQENKITQPAYWNDTQWNGPDYPVVGVSWFEAVAYCRWLSKQTGIEFRLPSEAEWEKAARGSDGLIYPWGNTWDASLVNSSESGLNKTMPVGSYPKGASPYGALDMAGNVWEWCATQWGKPYPYQLEDEWQAAYLEADATSRVLRGGASWNNSTYVRGADRNSYDPRGRFIYLGLRVASHSLVP